MSQPIVKWLRRVLGRVGLGPDASVVNSTLPSTERIGDALVRGARLRPVLPSDLSSEFESRLLDVCRTDSNVAGVWLTWLSSSEGTTELLATLLLDRPHEPEIRAFIGRANGLGGPSFVVAIPNGMPSTKAFYRREHKLNTG